MSSGAIAAGLSPLALARRPGDLATQQAAAAVGQGLLVHRYNEEFARHGIVVGQVLLTVDDVTRRSHYRNAYRTFARLLELGVLPVVNENDTVATSEIRFGDNDRLAALVAHLVHADLLLLLSDVDGLYDGNPARPGTTMLSDVVSDADLDAVHIGRTGAAGRRHRRHADQGRGRPDRHRGRHPRRADLGRRRRRRARRRAGGHDVPPDRPPPAHPAALAGPRHRAAGPDHAGRRGRAGGHRAACVAAARGHHRGRPAPSWAVTRSTWSTPTGVPVARGLVNYDADELPALLGRSTHDLARELGASYEREVVHRDDLVLLPRTRPDHPRPIR